MKRTTAEPELDSLSMADCLMSLSRGRDFSALTNSPSRTFQCKTCNRQFPSFQALGGHRASHKKPRLMIGGGDGNLDADSERSPPAKTKTHECSICGLEFAIGQALGGHMRRHRAAGAGAGREDHRSPVSLGTLPPTQVPALKKSNGMRVLCLDLNLTPMENDLELEFRVGKVAPMVDCFL